MVLVERGFATSRQQAAELIDHGGVLVSGTVAVKASRLVAPSEPIHLTRPSPRYVSRGGEKLAAALERFDLEVVGTRALDAGSSTGGFTDCLLQHGVLSVTSLDVGRGQLHQRLRQDERVDVREQTDIRTYALEDAGGTPYDVVTADLSFISVTRAIPMLAGELARPDADLIVLVKPQFEAGRTEASRGRGVIRDATVHRRTLGKVCDALAAQEAVVMGAMPSPITGHAGNVEFLVHARAHADIGPTAGKEIDAMLDAVVTTAHDHAPVSAHEGDSPRPPTDEAP
ncbi:MAG: rRNA (cytidine1920-2-O)/16S rRNA (cytidine1409-2-O)-methyltransferase [Acidimicrobiaceae bacterium]|nr:rRNA (cytidine1920-2-O)/16S rRNA (cytidine1409-2-O)-methyltransferase [Acidimicrobiaceae bacterium]